MGPQVTAAILNFILLQKSSSPLQSVYFILFFSGRILICLGKNFKVIVHCCKKCGWWMMHNAYPFYIHYGCWLLRPWIRAVSFGFQTITFIFSLHAFLFNSSTIVFLTNNWRIYIQHLIQNVDIHIYHQNAKIPEKVKYQILYLAFLAPFRNLVPLLLQLVWHLSKAWLTIRQQMQVHIMS